jgi:elongation factor Ts
MSAAVSTEQIKELRATTGAGIMDCRDALDKAGGDFEQAVIFLREKGLDKAAKRSDREASEGVVELYSHGDGRVGVMVEVNCETDFVARSEAFLTFAHEIALQIAAGEPKWVSEDQIPEDVLEDKRQIARSGALEEGKPENIVKRIVEGRLEKFKDEVCLLRQPYIRNDEKTVQELLSENIVAMGEKIAISRFERWELGENIEE